MAKDDQVDAFEPQGITAQRPTTGDALQRVRDRIERLTAAGLRRAEKARALLEAQRAVRRKARYARRNTQRAALRLALLLECEGTGGRGHQLTGGTWWAKCPFCGVYVVEPSRPERQVQD